MKTILLAALLAFSFRAQALAPDAESAVRNLHFYRVAVPLSAFAPVRPSALYSALSERADWRRGYTTIFVGRRLSAVSHENFLRGIGTHVRFVAKVMKPRGLKGYLFAVSGDFEIAFQNWTSKAAADAAFATPAGAAISTQAGELLKFEAFGDASADVNWLNTL